MWWNTWTTNKRNQIKNAFQSIIITQHSNLSKLNALATRISEFRFFDFSALFRQVFGRILTNIMQLFGRYFARKYQEILLLSFFGRYFALGRLSAFSWPIFGTYLEIKEGIGRLLEFSFCFSSEVWDKFLRKTWWKLGK